MPSLRQRVTGLFNGWFAPQQPVGDLEANLDGANNEQTQESATVALDDDEVIIDIPTGANNAPLTPSTWDTLSHFISFIWTKENLPALTTVQILNVVGVAGSILTPLIFAKTTEAAFNDNKAAKIGDTELSLDILVSLLTTISALTYVTGLIAQKAFAGTRGKTYAEAVYQSTHTQLNQIPEIALKIGHYNLMKPIQKSMGAADFGEKLSSQTFQALLSVVLGSCMMTVLTKSPVLGISTAVTLAANAFWAAYRSSAVHEARTTLTDKGNIVWRTFNGALQKIGIVHLFGQFDNEMARIDQVTTDYKKALIGAENAKQDTNLGHVAISYAIMLFSVLYAAYKVKEGKLDVKDFITIVGYLAQTADKARESGSAILDVLALLPDLKEVLKSWLDSLTQIEDKHPDVALNLDARESPAIEFKKVGFRYPADPKKDQAPTPILKEISFRIEKGERAALVGTSGAGKSTIFKLLFGQYSPTGGSIEINGQNVEQVSLRSRQAQITLCTQEASLFKGSVEENIVYGAPGADESKIMALAQKMGLNDLFTTLPLDMDVGEHGGALSGGQKQKIALLRGLMKNPEGILLLDEITASLDALAAEEIVRLLKTMPIPFAALMITHDLNRAREFATKLIVIKEGVVIAEGTHDKLLETCEFYQQLWASSKKEAGSYAAMGTLMGAKANDKSSSMAESGVSVSEMTTASSSTTMDDENAQDNEDESPSPSMP